jgi:hypothetical protein
MIDLDATPKITLYALLWGGLLILVLARNGTSRHGSTGLPFALPANYTLAHAGALLHLVDGYDHTQDAYLRDMSFTSQTVADGLEASWLGMFGAAIGFFLAESMTGTAATRRPVKLSLETLRHASLALLAIGAAVMLVQTALDRMAIAVAGLQAVMSNGRNLIVVGACGLVMHAYAMGNARRAMIMAGIFALLVPAVALVATAILAESVGLALAIMAFYMTLQRPGRHPIARDLTILAGVAVFCFFFAAAYMQSREALRSVVWSGGSIGAAVATASDAARSFDVGSSTEHNTLAMLDSRLNQNIFIGLAIEKLRRLPDTYEDGETILLALFGWLPRFLWPDKPERGGSSFLVKHTGKATAEGTTFGAGLIFEFYVNFAYPGVFIGFIVIGVVLRAFDIAAVNSLRAGRIDRFAQYYLAGLPLLQPLADLFFTVGALGAALVLGRTLRFAWKKVRSPE